MTVLSRRIESRSPTPMLPDSDITLNDILITEDLWQRSPRSPNWQAESEALRSLARQLVYAPEVMLQSLVDWAVQLCDPEPATAGVSLVEMHADQEDVFRWVVLSGTLAHHVGGCAPRHFSPCAVCLEQGAPVLFSYPERYFTYFQAANLPFVEALVLPLIAEGQPLGTLWLVTHSEGRSFDPEDVRLMTGLADFTAAALLRNQQQTQALLAANARLEAEVTERRLTEARALALIKNLPGGAVFIVDRHLRYQLAQGEALFAAGFVPDDLVGRTIFEALPPELATEYATMYCRALAGESFEQEHQAHGHWYISRGTPLYADQGEIYAVLVVSYDITDRKRVEDERKRAEAAIAADLRDTRLLHNLAMQIAADDQDQALYQYILDAAIALMQADMGSLQILDRDRHNLLLQTWQGLRPDAVALWRTVGVDDGSVCSTALRRGERVIVPNMDACDWFSPADLDTFHRYGIKAVQATPLFSRSGQLIGMFSTQWCQPYNPCERELRFLDLLARQAADLMEQRQAEAALRESEAKYRSLFNSIDEGFHIIELIDNEAGDVVDYRFLGGNPAFERLTGLKNTAGKLGSVLAPQTESSWLDAYDRVARTGEPLRIENYNEDTERWYSAYASRIEGAGSRQVAIVFDDITERKQVEVRLRRVAEQDAFRLKLSDTLRSLADPADIEETVTRITMDHFGADRCYYCEIKDGIAIIRRDAAREDLPTVAGEYPLSSFAILQAVIEAGHPFVVQDVHTTDTVDADLRQLCIQLQVISYIDIPIIKNGKPVGVLCLVQSTPRDWTDLEVELAIETADRTWAAVERARAEAALRENEQRLSVIFAQAAVGLSELSIEGHFEQVNDALCDMLGRSRQELLAIAVSEVIHPEDVSRSLAALAHVLASGESMSLDKRYRRADGTFFWANSILTPLDDDQGQRRHILAVTVDLSDRQQAEAAREQIIREQAARSEAERASRMKDEFLSMVSHELQSPLVAILGWTRLLRATPPTPQKLAKTLEIIERNATLQAKLIQDLLDISRITAGKFTVTLQPIALELVMESAIAAVTSLAMDKGVHLVGPQLPQGIQSVQVMGDRDRLQQVLHNLLTNAIKFTPPAGCVRIQLTLVEGKPSFIAMDVTDTGLGMTAEFLPHVFDRFRQAELSGASQGMGLGLAIAKHLVECHRGTLKAKSPGLGQGSTFTIQLPLLNAHGNDSVLPGCP